MKDIPQNLRTVVGCSKCTAKEFVIAIDAPNKDLFIKCIKCGTKDYLCTYTQTGCTNDKTH